MSWFKKKKPQVTGPTPDVPVLNLMEMSEETDHLIQKITETGKLDLNKLLLDTLLHVENLARRRPNDVEVHEKHEELYQQVLERMNRT